MKYATNLNILPVKVAPIAKIKKQTKIVHLYSFHSNKGNCPFFLFQTQTPANNKTNIMYV